MLDAVGDLIKATLEALMASGNKRDALDDLRDAARREKLAKMGERPGDRQP